MSAERRAKSSSGAVAAVCVAVILAGAGGTYVVLRDDAAQPRQGTSGAQPPQPTQDARSDASSAGASGQTAKIVVTETAFEPANVSLRGGIPARITFVRTSDKTCATEVIFPALNIKRALPLNQAVAIEFTPAKAGEITFACGMNMVTGTIVVR